MLNHLITVLLTRKVEGCIKAEFLIKEASQYRPYHGGESCTHLKAARYQS